MKILLPETIVDQLTLALQQAGKQEIGGILMGEHVGENVFRVKAITVQTHGGTFITFKRVVQSFLAPLRRFFRDTGYNYTKFNYLGEWHSHPAFSPEPSSTDSETMWELVQDTEVGATFAVLLVLRLESTNHLKGSATFYLPNQQRFAGELIQEANRL